MKESITLDLTSDTLDGVADLCIANAITLNEFVDTVLAGYLNGELISTVRRERASA
jgi:hypothetical protein